MYRCWHSIPSWAASGLASAIPTVVLPRIPPANTPPTLSSRSAWSPIVPPSLCWRRRCRRAVGSPRPRPGIPGVAWLSSSRPRP
eukprot:445600-Hanusia_phi.AAC.1